MGYIPGARKKKYKVFYPNPALTVDTQRRGTGDATGGRRGRPPGASRAGRGSGWGAGAAAQLGRSGARRLLTHYKKHAMANALTNLY